MLLNLILQKIKQHISLLHFFYLYLQRIRIILMQRYSSIAF